MFGVGMTDGIVVGRSGVPNGDAAGAIGATVVTAEAAGASAGEGGATGTPGDSGGRIGPCDGVLKKPLAISASSAGSGQEGAGIEIASQKAGGTPFPARP
jgi:hypothetical protein